MGRLRFGSLDPQIPEYDSLADFHVQQNRIELRIPWGLINFTDPSSRMVLWLEKGGKARKTEGIRMLAVSYKPAASGMAAADTGRESNIADSLPAPLAKDRVALYSWEGWDTPVYHTYEKESFRLCRRAFEEMPEGR
jgi:hypothetical protein